RGIFAAPTMKDMLPDIFVRGHFYFYWFFLPSVIAAAFFPRDCTFYAGLFLALSNIFLWVNLIRVVFKYRTINKLHPVSPLKTG
ncbi:MAG: hypothetical protein OEV66_09695, partial [Spirochaetia bacterium]|nr:hypothetical protein [Spirochaetia bacterium]